MRVLPDHLMGVASGSVLEALESEVLFLGPLLKDLSCLPPLEIQSSLAESCSGCEVFVPYRGQAVWMDSSSSNSAP